LGIATISRRHSARIEFVDEPSKMSIRKMKKYEFRKQEWADEDGMVGGG
jgi:hypothetical protein